LTPQGNLVVNTPGAVISGLDITGCITVNAPNVTIENCRIDANGGYFCIKAGAANGATGLTVKDCTLLDSKPGIVNGQNILCTGATIENCNISGMTHCISSDGGNLIQNNYMHDLNGTPTGHYECIYIGGGAKGDTIEHNTMISFDTADIFMATDYGPVTNEVVENNLLLQQNSIPVAGKHTTSYNIYLSNTGGGASGNVVTGNILQKGYYGYTDVTDPSVVWRGNTDYSTGQTISVNGTLTAAPASAPTGSSAPGSSAPATAPKAPVIVSFSPDTGVIGDRITSANTLDLKGTADPNSTITVYDGSTKLGTATANSTGSWDYITKVLTDAKHVLTATETMSGKTSAASAPLTVTIDTHVPAAPVLTSDSVINTKQVLLSGTAEANSTITVYDGTTAVGTGATNSSGTWSVTTSALSSGAQALTAKATDAAGNVSAASQPLDPVIPARAPATSAGPTGLVHVGNNYFLGSSTGPELKHGGAAVTTGEFQDWTPIAAVHLASGGYDVAWKNSSGQFTFWATDSRGNFQSYPTHGVALAGNSATVESYETIFHQDLNGDHTIGIPGATPTLTPTSTSTSPASAVNFTSLTESSSHVVTIQGTADALSHVKLYDGTTSLGTVTTGSNGTWTYTTSSAVSDTLHKFTAQEVGNTGHVVATSSGAAIMAASNTSTMTGTGGNDFLYSGSSNLSDTFVFASNFGNSAIQGFSAGSGSGHDVIQFSKSVFDSFATVLSHASQVGQDVVISSGNETLKLLNTKLSALNSQDFHFA
jgi:hypothetical protein